MESYGWIVETHEFWDTTPFGEKKFGNIIANMPVGKDFNADHANTQNRTIFACHHDSKYFSNFKFYGATDSAVPCAILLDMAKFIHDNFDKEEIKNVNYSL